MSTLLVSLLVIISIIAIILLTSAVKLKAFVALFLVSLFLAVTTLPPGQVISTIKDGFGSTMGSIGLLIILGTMIGVTLDRTGATIRMAEYIVSKTGEKRSAHALGMTGFLTGLPIFCDSGFIILSGLAKSFSVRSGLPMAFMATLLASSLYSVHCLIPPHPGALAAAGIMKANIGYLIVTGVLLAIPATIAAFVWSRWITRRLGIKETGTVNVPRQTDTRDLPPVLLSFLPVVVPLLLITVRSLATLFDSEGLSLFSRLFYFPGDPVIALSAGAFLSLFLLRKKDTGTLNDVFTEAVEKAGPILIVTAAGGMFGMVIKATGTGESLGRLLAGTNIGLVVPFLIAALMKTAQGSSTVAIITAASFMEPMLALLGLDTEWGRLLAMLSMGAGSMVVSHANDSYFWVVSNFSGIDINTALRVYTPATLIMGLVVFSFIWIISFFVI